MDSAPFVKSVAVDDTGPGPVEVRIHLVEDATLSLAGHGVVTTAFPDMTNGAAYPASGPSPDAVNELKLHSRGSLEIDTIRVPKH